MTCPEDNKIACRVATEYCAILKIVKWPERNERHQKLKTYVQSLEGSGRELILKYYPDLFCETTNRKGSR